ncbi:hypothetical protein AD931_02980 [Gluconobacter oxydans]|uniref:MobA/MobL protein domain-containing protein n=2 Tax=Gluconobacter oxydans TaxID=442 RepID=A0AB34XKE9_GLUOY|nr:MobA/MobL family protein [Gluconobacter oxydans]AHK70156.1 hypothetical protein GLS_c02330 [Gluconobacter oxydans DSM 3504]KXV09839.1 hypothetical protein AD931_02980 [Gluconobacter oxydans]
MLVQAHRFISLNQRLGDASTLTPGDIVDLAAFYQAGFPGEKAQNAALRKVLRQMNFPVKEFARDLHRVKALYSLQHSSIAATDGIGKTAARLRYICCNRQDLILLGERHGLSAYDTTNLRTLAERHETMAGQNGRIAECFIIALPREGTPEHHQHLVCDFAEKVTHGAAPWIAAIHYDRPGNPHVHLIALEQNKPRTGGKGRPSKVIGLSRKGALERVREEWAETHNRIMAGTGPPIDHRSLEDQGKGHLLPTLH